MKIMSMPAQYSHELTEKYWNNGTKDTFAMKARISPKKDYFANGPAGKKKLLCKGKAYEGVEVFHTISGTQLCFYCYVIVNDAGEISKCFEKGMFIESRKLRERILKDLLNED